MIPLLITSDTLFRSRRELNPRLEPKRRIMAQNEISQELDLFSDLILTQIYVTIILGKLPNSRQSRECS